MTSQSDDQSPGASFTFPGTEAGLQAEIARVHTLVWGLIRLAVLPYSGAMVIALVNVAAEMTVRGAPNPNMAEQWSRACKAALERATRDLAREPHAEPLS